MRTWGDLRSWGQDHGGKERARLQIQFNLQLAVPHANLSFPSMHMVVLQDDS